MTGEILHSSSISIIAIQSSRDLSLVNFHRGIDEHRRLIAQ